VKNKQKVIVCIEFQCTSLIPKAFIKQSKYCESICIGWSQFPWFLQNALIHGFLNSWFQASQATTNGKIVFRWIFMFVVLVYHEIREN